MVTQVLDRSDRVFWDDIAGQEAAKTLVQEMVVWPSLNPQLFQVGLWAAPPRAAGRGWLR